MQSQESVGHITSLSLFVLAQCSSSSYTSEWPAAHARHVKLGLQLVQLLLDRLEVHVHLLDPDLQRVRRENP